MLRDNNFDLMRLLLASSVIVSHSPQIIDGTPDREILFAVFGTRTLGEFAVDIFFLISGFLVMGSFLTSRSIKEYLWKRFLRIYPGFIVAYWVSILLAASLDDGKLSQIGATQLMKSLVRSLILAPPYLPGAFEHLPTAHINGSMWTIAYEFRCYILLMVFWFFGAMRRRLYLAITSCFLLILSSIPEPFPVPSTFELLLGRPNDAVRFAALFSSGATFYLYQKDIPYRPALLLSAAPIMAAMMFIPALEDVAVASCGAYLVFWVATRVRSETLWSLRPRADISYGIYLYGWPIQLFLLDYFPTAAPTALSAAALAVASIFGFASWKWVEEPCLRLKPLPNMRLV